MAICPNCRIGALNDDPEKKLCDICWRDAKIADLEHQLREADCGLTKILRHSDKVNEKGGE